MCLHTCTAVARLTLALAKLSCFKITLNGSGVLTGLIQKGVPLRVGDCRGPWTCYVRARLLHEMCLITMICHILQAIIINLLNYLETSIDGAIKKGDPTADYLGSLLSICLPTDDKTKDLMPITASRAPSVKPTPPPTTPTLKQAEATSAAGGQPASINVDGVNASGSIKVLQSNVSDDPGGGPDAVVTFCRLVPAGAAPVNYSTGVHHHSASDVHSSRFTVLSM